MKVVADTAIEFGGEVTGITLSSLDSFELTNPRITKTIITKDLFERKQEFFNHSDAFIVLPGGVGSLDELTEVLVSNQLGIINKPVGILNTNNYLVKLTLNENIKIDDFFINKITRISFLEKILLK